MSSTPPATPAADSPHPLLTRAELRALRLPWTGWFVVMLVGLAGLLVLLTVLAGYGRRVLGEDVRRGIQEARWYWPTAYGPNYGQARRDHSHNDVWRCVAQECLPWNRVSDPNVRSLIDTQNVDPHTLDLLGTGEGISRYRYLHLFHQEIASRLSRTGCDRLVYSWYARREVWTTNQTLLEYAALHLFVLANQADWVALDAWLDTMLGSLEERRDGYGEVVPRAVETLLKWYGHELPIWLLDRLDSRLQHLVAFKPDLDRAVSEFEMAFTRSYVEEMHQSDSEAWYMAGADGAGFQQGVCMLYPWVRRRLPAASAALRADLVEALRGPGPPRSQIPKDGAESYGLGGAPLILEPGAAFLHAHHASLEMQRYVRQRQLHGVALLTATEALLHYRLHGRWPTSIGELGSSATHGDPMDPAGRPLGLRMDADGGLRIWALDGQGRDHGGHYEGEFGYQAAGGYLLCLRPPAEAPER